MTELKSPPVIKSPDQDLALATGLGLCRCTKFHPHKHYHFENLPAPLIGKAAFDWQTRHALCELEMPGSVEFNIKTFTIPRGFDDRPFEKFGISPPWTDWRQNANATIIYVADAAFTMDLSALGSSSTFVAGRESTSVANSSNYLDCKITGRFISGTTPTLPAEARLYVVEPYEDTPAWPDVFDGTDSAETVANTQILDAMVRLWSGTASASTNITYPVTSALTLAQACGFVPKNFGLFFTHFHTAALKTDAGNTNSFNYQFAHYALA